jgi:hypothetical protein
LIRHRGGVGDLRQGHVLFEMSAQLAAAFERALTLRLGEFGQHGGCRQPRFHAAGYDN